MNLKKKSGDLDLVLKIKMYNHTELHRNKVNDKRTGESLTAEDIKRKNELVAELKMRFNDVEKAITQYNDTVTDANQFIGDMFSLLDKYYDLRSQNWQESPNGDSYNQFMEEWRITISDIPDIEDRSSVLEDLPVDLSRSVKRPQKKTQLFFSRKL